MALWSAQRETDAVDPRWIPVANSPLPTVIGCVIERLFHRQAAVAVGIAPSQRSSGRSPVSLAILASAIGPISSLSWKQKVKFRLRDARKAGDRREGPAITKNAMKFDRQIVAISLVCGARVLYSDDDGVAKFAAACGSAVKRVTDLPVPASQQALQFAPEIAEPASAQPSPTVRTEAQPAEESRKPIGENE
jgi:hypothetical protein